MTKDQKLDVRISAELKQEIADEAQHQDRSKAWIVIAALRKYLEERKEK